MQNRERRERPSWPARKRRITTRWLIPFHAIEYGCEWIAHALSGWVLVEALEYLGKFSVLIAVIFYFSESGDRTKQKHYQAWQVINTAQGMGGSGGRIEALAELNQDHVALVGVNVSKAFLQGVNLDRANLVRANFEGSDARNASLKSAKLSYSSFVSANLRQTHLDRADLANANLEDADLNGATLTGATLEGAILMKADLRGADLRDIKWSSISGIKLANILGVKNPPNGFVSWAMSQGAVAIESDDAWQSRIDSGK